MKSNFLQLATGVLLAGILASCEKETSFESGNTPTTPPSPTTTGTYIDRVRFTEIINSGLDSFTYVKKFNYDANKRLISIIDDSMFVSPGHIDRRSYSLNINFFYNAADTMPYKMVEVIDVVVGLDPTKETYTTHFYYAGNKLLKDSLVYEIDYYGPDPTVYDTTVRTFGYAPGKIFIKTFSTLNDHDFDTLMLDANENITKCKTYYDTTGGLANTGVATFGSTITYDNKTNPLWRFKPFYRYIITGPEPNYGGDLMNGFNNYTKLYNYGYYTSGLEYQILDETYTYQYNVFGYPTLRSLGWLPPNKSVYQYYYKNL